jgi:hypothetical protein
MRARVIAIAAMAVVSLACVRPRAPQALHDSRSFPASPDKLVRLDLRSLDARVRVTEGPSITVSYDFEVHSSSRSYAQRWIADHTPQFDDSPAGLEVRVRSRHGSFMMFGFLHTKGHVEVSLPPTCRLEVVTSSGDVRLDGEQPLSGAVRVNTSSGDVRVAGGARELIVRTTSGDLRVDGNPLTTLECSSSSGDLTLHAGAARVLADSTSGDIELDRLAGDLSAHTSSGQVRGRWDTIPAGANIKANTTSGEVTLRLPEGTTLTGEITTNSGEIESTFSGGRTHRERRLQLDGGVGAVQVMVRTSSGDIRLLRRPAAKPATADRAPKAEDDARH